MYNLLKVSPVKTDSSLAGEFYWAYSFFWLAITVGKIIKNASPHGPEIAPLFLSLSSNFIREHNKKSRKVQQHGNGCSVS